jgi:hypothetical protein
MYADGLPSVVEKRTHTVEKAAYDPDSNFRKPPI